ncbi:MAG: XRE family transcriptional regulator [Lentisphaeria bacterium]
MKTIRRTQTGKAGTLARVYDFGILRELRRREGWTIGEVSSRSGVSAAVISKLERNQTKAELETLFRLARVFGLTAGDLLSLAESNVARRTAALPHRSGGFEFQEARLARLRILYGTAPKGAKLSRPEVHHDDYEYCYVVRGRVRLTLPKENHELGPGDAIQFDAVWQHTYEALEACQVVILHLAKDNRVH